MIIYYKHIYNVNKLNFNLNKLITKDNYKNLKRKKSYLQNTEH